MFAVENIFVNQPAKYIDNNIATHNRCDVILLQIENQSRIRTAVVFIQFWSETGALGIGGLVYLGVKISKGWPFAMGAATSLALKPFANVLPLI